MTDTGLHPQDTSPPTPPSPADLPASAWSRRRVLALVCAGGALSAAGSISLIAASADTEPSPRAISRRSGGTWTSFGTIAVLSATRDERHDSSPHAEKDPTGPCTQLANMTWSNLVRVLLEVHNGSGDAVLLSSGQFRLRLGTEGTTVSPYDTGRPAAPLPAAQTVQTWISYLAPAKESDLRLEYDDTGLADSLGFRLSLPVLATSHVHAAGASR